jgi:peptidoglycan/LPS O-acetylase OafA/YrhL
MKEISMVQIAALVLGFPAGFLLRPRGRAFLALTVVLGVLLVVQTIAVADEGDLDKTVDHLIYWPVQAVSLAVAFGLATWGGHGAAKRRAATGAGAGA